MTVDFCAEICRALADAHCSTSLARPARVAVAPEVVSAVADTVKSSAYEVVRVCGEWGNRET